MHIARLALCLAVLAAGVGAALGSRATPPLQQQPALLSAGDDTLAGGGRRALQGTSCSFIPQCTRCEARRQGTTTTTVCSACSTGYAVRRGGRACWCAPGFKKSGTTCVPCSEGMEEGKYGYCPGSSSVDWESATFILCGANKYTASAFATTEKACVAKPGYGWVDGAGAAAELCDYGYYNNGGNNRKCTRCPGGLTTASQGSTTSAACVAGPGYTYRGKAIPCSQGSYKPTTGNGECTPCPPGFTTAEVASINSTLCNILKPGFSAPAGAAGVVEGALCEEDTYRSANHPWDAAAVANGVACDPCPAVCTTNGVVGAQSVVKCITPPGHGWTGSACEPCPLGSYNEGFNHEACNLCGTGITTEDVGAIEQDMCMIRAGHGTARDPGTGALSAAPCPLDTYGREDATFGLVDVECTKCMDNTHTLTTENKNPGACVSDIGHGWDDGAINPCDYSYWSSGGSKAPCTFCGDGKNTSDPAAPTVPANTATNASWCVIAAGWTTDGAGGVKPCVKGSYKSNLGSGDCVSCGAWGLTTSVPYSAIQRTDCDSCLPGYGTVYPADTNILANGSFASLATAACSKCPSGYYSAGNAPGGAFCTRCPETADYDGVMVSKPGSVTPDSCVRQFPTGNSSMANHLQWDVLPMAAAALTVQPSATDIQACQAGCKGNARCQYFVFYNYGTDSARCYYRLAAADIVKVAGDVQAPGSAFYVMLEVKEGQYVTYTAADSTDTTAIGTTIATHGTFDSARTACDGDPGCAGFANTAAASWRTFRGSQWEGAVGKVRAVGETINSWTA